MDDHSQYSEPMRCFTFFAQLPFELREQVWDEAIQNRHAKPLAHFFTLHNEAIQSLSQLDGIRQQGALIWFHSTSHFGPPVPEEEFGISHSGRSATEDMSLGLGKKDLWDHPSNKSGYLLDSGLWGACIESRKAMVRNWQRNHGTHCCGTTFTDQDDVCGVCSHPYYYASAYLKNPYRLGIASVPRSDLEERWIVTRPEVDLYMCDVPELATSTGSELAETSWRYPMYARCHNLALKFDTEWGVQLDYFFSVHKREQYYSWAVMMLCETELGGLARQFDQLDEWGPRSLWLIDAKLQPGEGVSYNELVMHRKVFHAQGQQYIEVDQADMERTWTTMEAPDSGGGGEPIARLTNAHQFLEEFHEIVKEYYLYWAEAAIHCDFDQSRYVEDYQDMAPKVLACLKNESRLVIESHRFLEG